MGIYQYGIDIDCFYLNNKTAQYPQRKTLFLMANVDQIKVHPPKFNMEPENDGFQVRNLRFKGWFSGGFVMMYGTEVIWYKLKPATVQRIFDTKTSDPHTWNPPSPFACRFAAFCARTCQFYVGNGFLAMWATNLFFGLRQVLIQWAPTNTKLLQFSCDYRGNSWNQIPFRSTNTNLFLLDMLHPGNKNPLWSHFNHIGKVWGWSFLSTWMAWPQLWSSYMVTPIYKPSRYCI